MKQNIILLLIVLLITNNYYAQQRTCNYVEYMQEKLQDPQYRAQYEAQQQKFQIEYERLLVHPEQRLQTIFIPVAVHYPSANESDRVCLENLAQDQIRILNEDFSATNADISDWTAASPAYPGINLGSIDVQFVIATQNHPLGVDPDIVEGGLAVTVGNSVGENDSRWSGYQNFIIKPISGGVLGYSPLGGQPSFGQSVVMNTYAFGSGTGCSGGYSPNFPFNLGRTVTHELGHFYNLDHTWGIGGCGEDDLVEDTPNISGPSYDCQTPGSVMMCGNASLTTNYMDYVDDRCMFMFTQGQATRMNAYINTIKDDWDTNVLSVNAFEINKVFSIYPNPANNELNISLMSNNLVKEASYQVYDILGKSVTKGDLNLNYNFKSKTIKTNNLDNGVYLLKIKSDNLFATKKIVVRH